MTNPQRDEEDIAQRRSRAEIALRYGAAERDQVACRPRVNFRQRELDRLWRHRQSEPATISALMAEIGDIWAWSPRDLGQIVNLTLVERMALDIRSIQANDVTEEVVKAAYLARRREKQAAAARNRRRTQTKRKTREEKVLSVLLTRINIGWTSASLVGELVRKTPAFKGVVGSNLRQVVRRAAAEQPNEIEARKIIGEGGFPVLQLRVRLNAAT